MSAGLDWSDDAFFDAPERGSLDGGTTSVGHLWHSISPRWGHAMHTMCSYHGMFPAKVAHYFIQRYSRPGDVVLDPFSGRGTTALQARAEGRKAISNDLNPLAYVLSRAKSDPPSWEEIHTFLDGLETEYKRSKRDTPDVSPDIQMLYHDNTLKQLCYIRERLLSKNDHNLVPGRAHARGCVGGHHARLVATGRHQPVPEHQHAEHLQHVSGLRREIHPEERPQEDRPRCLRAPARQACPPLPRRHHGHHGEGLPRGRGQAARLAAA